MELRPGSTFLNVPLASRNESPAYREAGSLVDRLLVEMGLPER
jgi:hypothetical protein